MNTSPPSGFQTTLLLAHLAQSLDPTTPADATGTAGASSAPAAPAASLPWWVAPLVGVFGVLLVIAGVFSFR